MRIPGALMSADADAEQQAAYSAYKTLVTNIAKDRQGGLLLPSDLVDGEYAYTLEYVLADGRRPADMGDIITRHNQTMATSILADFIFLGQQAVGSFALSSDKTQLFATALGAYLRGMEEVLNRHLLPKLWDLNNLDPVTMPKIRASEVEQPSLAEIGTYLQALAAAGAPIFPDRGMEEYVREIANLPEMPEGGIPTAPTTLDAEDGAEGTPKDGASPKKPVPAKRPTPVKRPPKRGA